MAANLLTLLALVCTAWWSSAQRPSADHQRRMVQAAPAAAPAQATGPVLHRDNAEQAPDLALSARPALNSPALEREGLRTVGFVAGGVR